MYEGMSCTPCMSTVHKQKPMNLIQAVRELREKLGDSQQAFATRLGISIRAVANYEKDRAPAMETLSTLSRVADQAGERELANVFLAELGRKLHLNTPGVMMAAQWDDDRTANHCYLIVSGEGRPLVDFVHAAYETFARFMSSTTPVEVKTRAEELLTAFKESSNQAWRKSK